MFWLIFVRKNLLRKKSPIRHLGNRHTVMCSNGHMYEFICMFEWFRYETTSPVTGNFLDFVDTAL